MRQPLRAILKSRRRAEWQREHASAPGVEAGVCRCSHRVEQHRNERAFSWGGRWSLARCTVADCTCRIFHDRQQDVRRLRRAAAGSAEAWHWRQVIKGWK